MHARGLGRSAAAMAPPIVRSSRRYDRAPSLSPHRRRKRPYPGPPSPADRSVIPRPFTDIARVHLATRAAGSRRSGKPRRVRAVRRADAGRDSATTPRGIGVARRPRAGWSGGPGFARGPEGMLLSGGRCAALSEGLMLVMKITRLINLYRWDVRRTGRVSEHRRMLALKRCGVKVGDLKMAFDDYISFFFTHL